MNTSPLTPRQKQCLQLMWNDGDELLAVFRGGTREFHKGVNRELGYIVIQCYGEPDRWLGYKGLVEEAQHNLPVETLSWRPMVALTDAGRAAVQRLKKDWTRYQPEYRVSVQFNRR